MYFRLRLRLVRRRVPSRSRSPLSWPTPTAERVFQLRSGVWNNTHWGWKKAKALGHARWATTGALALVSCAPARLLLKRWWAGANHRSDQREFIRVLGREERVSVIAQESSPRGAYDNRTYVLHRCGGCRWMPPLERLLNASRAANGVDDASAADALAAVWETRVLATFKY